MFRNIHMPRAFCSVRTELIKGTLQDNSPLKPLSFHSTVSPIRMHKWLSSWERAHKHTVLISSGIVTSSFVSVPLASPTPSRYGVAQESLDTRELFFVESQVTFAPACICVSQLILHPKTLKPQIRYDTETVPCTSDFHILYPYTHRASNV